MTEAIALYLQKYILYRKRKVFYASGTTTSIKELIKKYKSESYLFPCSDIHKKIIIYKTVNSDLAGVSAADYDMIVFFSPSGIKSFRKSFPSFEQGDIRIAAFGPTTTKSVEFEGFRLDIKAPEPESPSMAQAIDNYLKSLNGSR